MVQQRVLETAGKQFLFRVTPEARAFLLREGTDIKYGARHLKRAIERHIVYPLANLLATEQIRLGDVLAIDSSGEGLIFRKEAEGAVLPVELPLASSPAPAAAVSGGRTVEIPAAAAAGEAKSSNGNNTPQVAPAKRNRDRER